MNASADEGHGSSGNEWIKKGVVILVFVGVAAFLVERYTGLGPKPSPGGGPTTMAPPPAPSPPPSGGGYQQPQPGRRITTVIEPGPGVTQSGCAQRGGAWTPNPRGGHVCLLPPEPMPRR